MAAVQRTVKQVSVEEGIPLLDRYEMKILEIERHVQGASQAFGAEVDAVVAR